MPEETKWEYWVETLGTAFRGPKDDELEAHLNQLGSEGWEVFEVEQLQNSPKIRLVARRPLSATTRRQRRWPQS